MNASKLTKDSVKERVSSSPKGIDDSLVWCCLLGTPFIPPLFLRLGHRIKDSINKSISMTNNIKPWNTPLKKEVEAFLNKSLRSPFEPTSACGSAYVGASTCLTRIVGIPTPFVHDGWIILEGDTMRNLMRFLSVQLSTEDRPRLLTKLERCSCNLNNSTIRFLHSIFGRNMPVTPGTVMAAMPNLARMISIISQVSSLIRSRSPQRSRVNHRGRWISRTFSSARSLFQTFSVGLPPGHRMYISRAPSLPLWSRSSLRIDFNSMFLTSHR
jgi:hypothetical protein